MRKLSSIVVFVLFWTSAGRLPALPAQSDTSEPLAIIAVEAGNYTRIDTPVSVSLEGIPDANTSLIGLREIKGSERMIVASQVESNAGGPKLWWILDGTTPAGSKRIYELVASAPPRVGEVTAIKDDKVLLIQKGDQKVLQYNHAIVPAPQGKSSLYDRSGFIHPLWSPEGSVLTDIHPPDHIHHLGIWMPWTHTQFEGKPVDFWNLGDGTGTVRATSYLSETSGPVYGGFAAEHEHVALKTSQGEKVVLKEVWDARVYNVGGNDKGYWLFDFKSTQRCVADSPLYQIEYRYGGFGFRGSRQWKGENASYLTSEGKTRVDGHATRARWCDTAGAIEGKWAGVTHFSHPQNFRHPEPMRIWPEFEKQVFFNWAPSQAGDWVMQPGEDHVFRYRLYVHEGKVNVDDVERIWHDYAEPPQVFCRVCSAHQKSNFPPKNATVLFDGTDFSHWVHQDGKDIQWEIAGDAMKSVPKTGSIMTRQDYRDFKLHIEFKVPEMPADVKGQGRGNSGVYLQRRYEVQILDSYGLPAMNNGCGSLYRVRAPDKNACKKPGQWQSFDIIFHAAQFKGQGENARKDKNARITVWHNGVLIHDDVEIPNKTGAGQPEGPEPGPILLQEHGNEVMFRNIWIVPLNEK